HTRFSRDWSSDVCSSDLYEFYTCVIDSNGDIDKACEAVFGDLKSPTFVKKAGTDLRKSRLENYLNQFIVERQDIARKMDTDPSRSEERRVGKEGRCRRAP